VRTARCARRTGSPSQGGRRMQPAPQPAVPPCGPVQAAHRSHPAGWAGGMKVPRSAFPDNAASGRRPHREAQLTADAASCSAVLLLPLLLRKAAWLPLDRLSPHGTRTCCGGPCGNACRHSSTPQLPRFEWRVPVPDSHPAADMAAGDRLGPARSTAPCVRRKARQPLACG
jgi:hypothetical protein